MSFISNTNLLSGITIVQSSVNILATAFQNLQNSLISGGTINVGTGSTNSDVVSISSVGLTTVPLNKLQTTISQLSLTSNLTLTPNNTGAIESGLAIFPIALNGYNVNVSQFVDFGSDDLSTLKTGSYAVYYFFRQAGINYYSARAAAVDLEIPIVIGTSSLTLGLLGQSYAALNWSLPTNAYNIELDQSTDNVTFTNVYTGKNIAKTILNLTLNVHYYYRLRGVNEMYKGAYTYLDFTTLLIDRSLPTSGYTVLGFFDFRSLNDGTTGTFNDGNVSLNLNGGVVSNKKINGANTGEIYFTYNTFTNGKTYRITLYDQTAYSSSTNFYTNGTNGSINRPTQIGTDAIYEVTKTDNTSNVTMYFDNRTTEPLTASSIKVEVKN